VRLTDILNSITAVTGLTLWLGFIGLYLAWGNRLRRPAGRAFMIMAVGAAAIYVPLVLHHPGGLSTDVVPWVAWVQVAGTALSCAGTGYLIAIGVRANGRWPWQ
jgi:hypothetical protein